MGSLYFITPQTRKNILKLLWKMAGYQIPAGLKYEIKSASNESVVSITKKLLLCTTPSFEALT